MTVCPPILIPTNRTPNVISRFAAAIGFLSSIKPLNSLNAASNIFFAGDTFLGISAAQGVATTSIADNGGNSYAADYQVSAGGWKFQVWRSLIATASKTITPTPLNGGVGGGGQDFLDCSGVTFTGALDAANSASGNSATPSISVTASGLALVIALIATDVEGASLNCTGDPGWQDLKTQSSNNVVGQVAWKKVNAGLVTFAPTFSVAANWGAVIASYRFS